MCSRRFLPSHSVLALWLVFFVNGAVLASWAPRIPEVKDSLGLSDAALGAALFGVAAGSVPSLLGAAWLLRHVQARTLCVSAGIVFAGALPLIAVTRDAVGLAGALVLLGAASGCLDVAMNTAGLNFERASRRLIISRLHGGYSLGVLAGAAGGAVATHLSIHVLTHFCLVSVVLVALIAVAARSLPAPAPPACSSSADAAPPPSPLRAITLLPFAIAASAIAGLLAEGTITDWSALMVSRDFDGGYGLGSATLVLFSVAMFCSRTASDWIVERAGRQRVLYGSAAVLAGATLLGFSQTTAVGAVVAIVAIGCALGPIFPLAMSGAADHSAYGTASATAALSAVGYLAYLAGPPIVGLAADHIGLTTTIAIVAAAAAATVALATHRLRSSAWICDSRPPTTRPRSPVD